MARMPTKITLEVDEFFTNTRIAKCYSTRCIFHDVCSHTCILKSVELNESGECAQARYRQIGSKKRPDTSDEHKYVRSQPLEEDQNE